MCCCMSDVILFYYFVYNSPGMLPVWERHIFTFIKSALLSLSAEVFKHSILPQIRTYFFVFGSNCSFDSPALPRPAGAAASNRRSKGWRSHRRCASVRTVTTTSNTSGAPRTAARTELVPRLPRLHALRATPPDTLSPSHPRKPPL